LLIGLGALLSFTFVGVTHASDVRMGDKSTVATSETIDSSLFITGQDVLVAGTVKGDVYCLGANVKIIGTVEGDVMCAGQSVLVAGKVEGNVRVAAQQVDIAADVSGDATLVGDSVVLGNDGHIGRDLTVGGNHISLEGTIGRDVMAKSQKFTLAGSVGRTVGVNAGSIMLAATAHIGGDFNYKSKNEAGVSKTSIINGSTHYTPDTTNQTIETVRSVMANAFFMLIALLILGWALVLAVPRKVDTASQTLQKRPFASFGLGVLAVIATPVVSVALFITGVGLPLGLVMLAAWLISLMVALPVAGYACGWLLTRQFNWPARGRRLANMTIGVALLVVISVIPAIGPAALLLAGAAGVGALVGAAKENRMVPVVSTKAKKAKS
ncbi:MAG TPA: hypothetical protein VLG40_02110, partial [Candidatus Saccharimonas sp.]|nr:hypothetical protein [Candidatus Saccharimonas sp.]